MTDLKALARQAMRDHDLSPEFSAEALRQLDAISALARETDPSIRDQRSFLWASIDNDDSLDLDQLSVAEPLADGAVKILVAIADVDAIVKADSPIDAHARANTTSVYTAAQTFPMLPEKLSTDLTSLAQDRERLSLVIEMTIDGAGAVTGSDVYRAIVLNKAKLAYNSVAAWLDGKASAPAPLAAVAGVGEQLRLQDRVAQALKRAHQLRGALSLETAEARPVLESGVLTDLRPDESNRAKELIEYFMIAANGVVAQFLEGKSLPSLRRVLPKPERWSRIVELAQSHGGSLPSEADAKALNTFLLERHAADPEHFADLSLAVVKLLGRGEYAVKQPGRQIEGHFGLAVDDYTHSTAPNRRFPDLVTQRLVKAALNSRPAPYDNRALAEIAEHCTVQEANAAKVERQVAKSAAALLLAPRIGQRFDAIVTGASDKGTWARIKQPMAEGRIVKGFEGLDVGDHVTVELIHTDVARGFIDFARAR